MIVRMMDTSVSNKPNKQDCNEMLSNLLNMVENPQNNHNVSTIIINKIFDTEQCDFYYPLTDLRKKYKDHLGHAYENAIALNKEEEVEYRATRTLSHYRSCTKERLVDTLSTDSKVYYFWRNR